VNWHLSSYGQYCELKGTVLVPGKRWLPEAVTIPEASLQGRAKPEEQTSLHHLDLTAPAHHEPPAAHLGKRQAGGGTAFLLTCTSEIWQWEAPAAHHCSWV